MGFPRFRAVAERGLLVEFAEVLSDSAQQSVLHLDRALAAHPFAGFAESVPAYVSLLVVFDPLVTDHRLAEAALRALLAVRQGAPVTGQLHEVLVCYDGTFAGDLEQVAALTGLSAEAVISLHLAGDYRVAMYGFAPGYAYLSGVPAPIHLPRKPAAVRGVAAGSVIVAGAQCLVTTLTMPTGWWVLGRSPTRVLTGDADRPFLFDVGDTVRFRRISRTEFDRCRDG